MAGSHSYFGSIIDGQAGGIEIVFSTNDSVAIYTSIWGLNTVETLIRLAEDNSGLNAYIVINDIC